MPPWGGALAAPAAGRASACSASESASGGRPAGGVGEGAAGGYARFVWTSSGFDGVSSFRRAPRGWPTGHACHCGWRRPGCCCRATGGRGMPSIAAVFAHERGHTPPGRLRGGPARRLAVALNCLPPDGAPDGRPAPVCSRSRRPTRWEHGSRGRAALPRGPLAPGIEAGLTVPILSARAFSGPGDPDQEDRDVA